MVFFSLVFFRCQKCAGGPIGQGALLALPCFALFRAALGAALPALPCSSGALGAALPALPGWLVVTSPWPVPQGVQKRLPSTDPFSSLSSWVVANKDVLKSQDDDLEKSLNAFMMKLRFR